MSGTVIESDTQAQAFTAAIKAHSGVWAERGMDPSPVRVGESFELEPCVSKNWPFRTETRPCPRVELWAENELSTRIVFATLYCSEDARPLLPGYVDVVCSAYDDDTASRAREHSFRALQSEAVVTWMNARWERHGKEDD